MGSCTARLLEDVGRVSESLASYEKALALDPDNVTALYLAAEWHQVRGSPAKGLPLIIKCTKLGAKEEKEDGTWWHVRGQLELALGKPAKASLDRALTLFRAAVDADASDTNSLFQIPCVQVTCGQRREALESLATAIRVDPTLKVRARTDADLTALRDDPAFQTLVR